MTSDNYRALKLLKLEEEHDGFPITSLREILILKRLRHKNIVSLLDVFTHKKSQQSVSESISRAAFNCWRQSRIFLVFEFVPHDLTGLIDYKMKWSAAQLKCILK